MGKKNPSTTEKSEQTTNFAGWTQDALQNLANTAANLSGGFLQSPAYATAGFNSDQLKGFDLARQSAMRAYTGGTTGIPTSLGYTPTNATAEQITGGAISDAMNPYLANVIDQTRKSGQRDLAETQAAIGARAAAAGSFGGSREAIQRGEADKNFAESMNSTVAQLMANGYDKASAIAQANAELRQQTGTANAAAANRAAEFGLTNGQNFAQVADALRTSQQAREMSALEALLGTGATQQQLAQTSLNVPFTMLNQLGQYLPQQLDSTTKGTSTSKTSGGSSPLQSLLGLGLKVGSLGVSGGGSLLGNFLAPKLSDEREKTDIKKIGRDDATGLDMYAYRYKGDPKTYPKILGPMAQDVEKKYPGSTRNIGGRLGILLGGDD